MTLTERQRDFLAYLQRRLHRDGKVPSLRQAAGDLGISHTAVAQLLAQLEKKGVVQRAGRYSRTLCLLPPTPPRPAFPATARQLPIIGRITAGLPMYAQQEWDGSVVVDGELFRGSNLFCLRVSGDSMRDAGILDGDLVVCEPRLHAEPGEIVVALINGEEATVKRLYPSADRIALHPENADYPVLRYRCDEVLVQGKVIGVVRGAHPSFSRTT